MYSRSIHRLCPYILLASPLCLGAIGCTEEVPFIPARAPESGDILISQLYTSGASPAGGTDHYYSDQFIELVNTASDPIDVSGLRIANAYGSAGAINPGMTPDSFRDELPDQVVMETIWRIPESTRVEPFKTLVIAHDGGNHRPFSDLDLSSAGVEAFVEESGRDEDYPTVPNLDAIVYNGGFDWLLTVFGPSVVVLDATTGLGEQSTPYGTRPTIATAAVYDGVDMLMNDTSQAFKRLPDDIDAGFTWNDGPYTGSAVHRKQSGGIWQDTNDSSSDFERGAPKPTLPVTESGVFGDPSLQLGGGNLSWVPIEDGDDIELVAGPQGGWHVDVSVWFDGFGPGGIELNYEAVDTTANRISFATRSVLSEDNVIAGDTGWYRFGDRIVLDIARTDDVVGKELILRLTAALGEQTWSDELRVQVVDRE